MAIYRNVHMSFWTDPKVEDDFTPEDKYFFLYLMTNPHTNLCGCYEISIKQMSNETGYNKDSIEKLIVRFSEVHNVIRYSPETKEMFIINWSKYNWQGGKQVPCIENEIYKIKDTYFREQLLDIFVTKFNKKDENGCPIQGAYKGHTYPIQANCIQATVTVTDNNNNINNDNNNNSSNTNNDNIKEKEITKEKEIEELFESLWKLYPRKLGKGSVKMKQKKILYGIGFEQMKKCIERFKSAHANTEEQYIPYGSTFFNTGYVDYLDTNYNVCADDCSTEDENKPLIIDGVVYE